MENNALQTLGATSEQHIQSVPPKQNVYPKNIPGPDHKNALNGMSTYKIRNVQSFSCLFAICIFFETSYVAHLYILRT